MAPPVEQPAAGLSNLQKRLLSAAVLLPVVIAAVIVGHPYFDILVLLFAAAMGWEWTRIVAHDRVGNAVSPVPVPTIQSWWAFSTVTMATAVIAVVRAGFGDAPSEVWLEIVIGMVALAIGSLVAHRRLTLWFVAGILYVAVPAVALVVLRADPTYGLATLAWIVAMVVGADTGGYLVGRTVGGPKLWPKVSPNKTWSGLAGAVGGAALAGLCTAFILNHTNVLALTLISAVLGVLEQGGDLVESAFKRHFGVKDTSQIIPGHGGVLDRVDGLLAVAVAVLVLSQWAGGSVLAW